MSTWPTSKLGQLAEISRGSSPRPIADTKYFENGQIPWIKIADATKSGKFLYETKEHVNDYGASFSRRLPPGTILVAASGTLGYTQILGVEGCAHDGWLILQNLRNLDRDFAYYTLKTLTQHFYNAGSGAAIQNINTEILRQTEIAHPPIAVQCRIASILGAYDDLIEVNRRRVKLLEEMARGLFEEWFVRFRFPGHENITIHDTPDGPIPEGWQRENVGSVLKKIHRPEKIKTSDYVNGGAIPCIDQGSDFIGGYTDNFEALISEPLPICVFGDHTRILKFVTFPFASGADGTQLLYPDDRITPEYLYFSLLAIDLSNQFYARHFKFLKEQKLLIPRNELILRFNLMVRPTMLFIQKLRDQNLNLATSRDLLLPRLISGQLSVEAVEQQLAAAD